MTKLKTLDICITVGGWRAIVLFGHTVYHEVDGGKLYTHCLATGHVCSESVGNDYDIEYILTKIGTAK